jgi:hypothetical protein
MRKIALASIVFGAFAVFALPPSPAHATSAKFWVSGTGTDSAGCTEPSNPCRSISYVIGFPVSGGTIHVLAGEYGGFTISKSVEIIADDPQVVIREGAVAVPGGGYAEIVVNAGPSDVVRIHGVRIDAYNDTGGYGASSSIAFLGGAALHLENSTLAGSGTGGPPALLVAPVISASGGVPVELSVRNSTIGPNPTGNVLIAPSNGVAVAALFDNVHMVEGLYGIRADTSGGSGLIRVDVRNSVAKGNSNNGFLAVGTGANPVHFRIDHSTAENNGIYGAIATGAQAFMIVGSSTLTGNGTGLAQQSGATVASYGNNGINFNTTQTSGTITPIALK